MTRNTFVALEARKGEEDEKVEDEQDEEGGEEEEKEDDEKEEEGNEEEEKNRHHSIEIQDFMNDDDAIGMPANLNR